MKEWELEKTKDGWFIGNFPQTIFQSPHFEAGIKSFKKGVETKEHFHKKADEINLILKGKIILNNKKYSKGDIILVEPLDKTKVNFLEDSQILVIKTPPVKKDKYFTE